MLVASLALGTAFALVTPATAGAQTVVSQGAGRFVTTPLLTSAVLNSLAPLKGASAVDSGPGADVIVDRPLDALALVGLSNLKVGLTNLPVFGTGGVIQVGQIGQYGRANSDGSSTAFSGTTGSASGLLGLPAGAVSPSGSIGAPTAGSGATITVGSPVIDPVALRADFVELAASAEQNVAGTQTSKYRLGSFAVIVGGSLVATPVSTIRPAIDSLIAAMTTAGVTAPANPFPADFTVHLTTADLQAAGLGSDLNNLPADTDLTQYIPLAVANRIIQETNDFVATATASVAGVPVGLQPALRLVIKAEQAIVGPVLANLGSSFLGPLGLALRSQAQLIVNHREMVNGALAQTALRVGLGGNGSLALVDLASATVGPNAGATVQPTTPTTTGSTAGAGGTGGAGTSGGSGISGTGATLAHTGAPLEMQLVPWGALALGFLLAGFVSFALAARRPRRGAPSGN
ncbi:hypothetical protein B7R21_01935 [Subtercola boreus]|uniref:Choice-of-anchor G family protein n=2 Tax=Subtercola boreus TaxID=120213 RepID=A0A3E0W1L3_9MICO|nr:hypothetical protein B7R21_01935 [Subtercola boreus]